MNFLALCQRTREKCGISGVGPSTVLNQTGEMLRVVNWVNEAWVDIQNAQPSWDWMRSEFSLPTVANKQAYAPVTDATILDTVTGTPITAFNSWRPETLRVYDPALGLANEQFMLPWDYDRFRNFYGYAVQPPGRPVCFSIRPRDKALLLGNTPDGVYTVRGEYQRDAQPMAADTDVPSLPSEYHMAIVYGAMMKYASYESAPEVFADGDRNYRNTMFKLSINQLGPMNAGPALA